MKKTIVLVTTVAIALFCVFQHSYAQTLTEAERCAAMDKNRVFLAMADEYIVSDALAAEGLMKGYVEKVPVAIYKIVKSSSYYGDTYYYGYLFGKEVRLSSSYYLTFASDEDYQYLVSRGALGEEDRKEAAKQFDKVQSAEFKKEVKALVEKDKKESLDLLQYLRRNRAVIWDYSVRRSYGDYTYYVEIKNWFPKSIKYVDLTVAALNSVGDPRWYDKDDTIRKITCVGYIDPLANKAFTFEDLYYDYYTEISKIVVLSAVITFEDNSKVSVTSSQAAQKLYYDNHNISLPKNFWKLIQ